MKCIECGEQPFGIGKLTRYQFTAGNAKIRFKCDQCSATLLRKETTLGDRFKRVISIFAITIAAMVLYYFISENLFSKPVGFAWLTTSMLYVAAFTFLAYKLDLNFIKFEKDSSTDPVMIMQIRKPGGRVFTLYAIFAIVLLYGYIEFIEPLFAEPLWGGILFILFMGLLLAIGSYLLKFYSEKVPA